MDPFDYAEWKEWVETYCYRSYNTAGRPLAEVEAMAAAASTIGPIPPGGGIKYGCNFTTDIMYQWRINACRQLEPVMRLQFGGKTYPLFVVDQDTLDRYETLEPGDLGRRFSVIQGSIFFLD